MAEKIGIEKILAVQAGTIELAVICKGAFKDGAQLGDAFAIVSAFADPVFRTKFIAAVSAISGVGAEAKDLDAEEVVQIGTKAVEGYKRVVAA